jgi:hypothetical protein
MKVKDAGELHRHFEPRGLGLVFAYLVGARPPEVPHRGGPRPRNPLVGVRRGAAG